MPSMVCFPAPEPGLGCADISGDSGAGIPRGLHPGPCLSRVRVGPSGLQTGTPAAAGPRQGVGVPGAPTPMGLKVVGASQNAGMNLPAEGEPTQSRRGLVG